MRQLPSEGDEEHEAADIEDIVAKLNVLFSISRSHFAADAGAGAADNQRRCVPHVAAVYRILLSSCNLAGNKKGRPAVDVARLPIYWQLC